MIEKLTASICFNGQDAPRELKSDFRKLVATYECQAELGLESKCEHFSYHALGCSHRDGKSCSWVG